MKRIIFILITLGIILNCNAKKIKVNVVPGFVNNSITALDSTKNTIAFLENYTGHFLEDFNVYRHDDQYQTIKSEFASPGFRIFSSENGKLDRHFYLIENYDQIDRGYYSVTYIINKKVEMPSFILYFITVEEMQPYALDIDQIESRIKDKFKKNISQIKKTNIKKLFKSNQHSKKIKLSIENLAPDNEYRGVNDIECIGNSDETLLFRFLIDDVGHSRAEYDIAVGLFCYISYDLATESIELYFTIVDFSIWVL